MKSEDSNNVVNSLIGKQLGKLVVVFLSDAAKMQM